MVLFDIGAYLVQGLRLCHARTRHIHCDERVFIKSELKAGAAAQIVFAPMITLLVVHLLDLLKLALEVDHLHFEPLDAENLAVIG